MFTVEECDAQIKNIKEQLLASNAGFSLGPADGGASRSVQRNDRDKLNTELSLWAKRKARASGSSRGSFRTKNATFARRC